MSAGRSLARLSKLSWMLLLALVGMSPQVRAADYPVRPIRLVVPFPTGGSTDILARIIGSGLTDRLGKPVVVENRPGAGGLVASEIVARASRDGYTLLMISSSFSVNPAIHLTLSFDPIKDFSPVVMAASTPLIIASTTELPVASVKDLIGYAKANPGKLSYGSTGKGSIGNLAGELFKHATNTSITYVPYGGAGPVFADVISGRIELAIVSVASALPHIQLKRLKALAVTSAERIKSLPQTSTVRESGVPGYEVESWQGLVSPADVPASILDRLHREVTVVVRTPEAERHVLAQGFELRNLTRDGFTKVIAGDIKKWTALRLQ